MRVAFYAPLKAPDHAVPSGDRQMARLLIKALGRAGHQVELVSRFRSFLASPHRDHQECLEREAQAESDRLLAAWQNPLLRPDLWFTYHNHHKAPDLLGPKISTRLSLPYVLAEASYAPRRAAEWGRWFEAAERAIHAADRHLVFTSRDRSGLAALLGPDAPLTGLPPFIDLEEWPEIAREMRSGPPRIATVAMMRPGDKLQSYRFLAAALAGMQDVDWRLTIVGDGPARAEVEACFAGIEPGRVEWIGLAVADGVRAVFATSDLYAWPGFGEAFGLGYLEAQAMGLPVVALETAGVGSVVAHGRTGVLVTSADPERYAAALRSMLIENGMREAMGREASAFIRRERTVEAAAPVLDGALRTAKAAFCSSIGELKLVRDQEDAAWRELEQVLDNCASAGQTVDVWVRDDDAISRTAALERLTTLAEELGVPVLLAVIPAGADAGLANFCADHPLLHPAQHGFDHINRAGGGERARELGGDRPLSEVIQDLVRGKTQLAKLFGSRVVDVLVPPWNRIDDAVVDRLAGLFGALSTFGDDARGSPALVRLNCDLDIIDWRGGRVGHLHDKLARRLADRIESAARAKRPLGILSHHLAHDETAWRFLDRCLRLLSGHAAVRFVSASQLIERTSARHQ